MYNPFTVSINKRLPDGEYKALWSAYSLKVMHDGKVFVFNAENAVKGINVPATVIVKNGEGEIIT